MTPNKQEWKKIEKQLNNEITKLRKLSVSFQQPKEPQRITKQALTDLSSALKQARATRKELEQHSKNKKPEDDVKQVRTPHEQVYIKKGSKRGNPQNLQHRGNPKGNPQNLVHKGNPQNLKHTGRPKGAKDKKPRKPKTIKVPINYPNIYDTIIDNILVAIDRATDDNWNVAKPIFSKTFYDILDSVGRDELARAIIELERKGKPFIQKLVEDSNAEETIAYIGDLITVIQELSLPVSDDKVNEWFEMLHDYDIETNTRAELEAFGEQFNM